MRFKNNNKKAKIAPTANSKKSYKHSATALSSEKHIVLILRIAGEFKKNIMRMLSFCFLRVSKCQ